MHLRSVTATVAVLEVVVAVVDRPPAVRGRRPGGAGAAAAGDSGRGRDPWDRDPADGDALHPRGRELEQVRDLGGRHQASRNDGISGPSARGNRRR